MCPVEAQIRKSHAEWYQFSDISHIYQLFTECFDSWCINKLKATTVQKTGRCHRSKAGLFVLALALAYKQSRSHGCVCSVSFS